MVTAGGKVFLAGLVTAGAGAVLLVSRGALPTSPEALRTHSGAAGLLAAGVVLAALGCFVYVLQPAVDSEWTRRVPFATVRTSLAMIVVAVGVATLLSLPVLIRSPLAVGAGGSSAPGLGALGLAYITAASEIPLAGVVWLRLVRPRCVTWAELGVWRGPLLQHVGTGLVGGVLLFTVAGVSSALLSRAGLHQNQIDRFRGIEGAPLGFFILALLAGSVLAPLAEELFFRGYVFRSFLDRHGPWWAYLFSAALFAVVHANLAAAVPIFLLGFILADIFRRSGSIVPGAIAHGINNAISFALLYAGFRG